ncbi:autotransporter outer membrane beta-barrel domain-containing protein [Phyllobacterium sp. 21LDTY02-6]|uniref:autotransporter outer membrane beta-barrel domain-containing protein n=1 Tax=Phyllobacterium sp. 21LDTY02-6 TaxID=2944903 RepID=UPI0020208667|nr:autotransporter outer membrane beta-barrel domain-containing protein [Phyllobacterium sp. 21LDTY02-6]MCO4318102.1 autotransporter outer membrane beta-barrel domain-containing protein [Phyllobacterium sp. 21LDTY02-6]
MHANDLQVALEYIEKEREGWFKYLKKKILKDYPLSGTSFAELDRKKSLQYQAIPGARKILAESDKDEKEPYLYQSFLPTALGSLSTKAKLDQHQSYIFAKEVIDAANKSSASLLKDEFLRGRPKEVLDRQGRYKKEYEDIKGSSFPSGHSWRGYDQALALAILFPERGAEIHSRGDQYAESRVVVGAHFPTDTIASRIGTYSTAAQLLSDDWMAGAFARQSKALRRDLIGLCAQALRECLERESTPLFNENAKSGFPMGSYGASTATPAALLPGQLPKMAANLLRLRFPYLNEQQRLEILASTAFPETSSAGWLVTKKHPDSRWGLINLAAAHHGPAYFRETMIVDQSIDPKLDVADFGARDRWKNDISGPGGLTKRGPGTLELSGNNSYSGSTTIERGALRISSDSNLGAAAAQLDMKDGGLEARGNFSMGRNIAIETTGLFDVSRTDRLDLTGAVTGAGTLIKSGGGVLHLGNTGNKYAATIVRGGTLEGAAGSIAGDIANAGTVIFEQSGNAIFGGDITAIDGAQTGKIVKKQAGKMVKKGVADLALEGSSALDWSIEQGKLLADAGRFHGNVQIGAAATLQMDQKQASVYSGRIAGAGSFVKHGQGALLLDGDSSGFKGDTLIAGGSLLVGDPAKPAVLGGRLKIAEGAVLGGSGQVGSIRLERGAMIAPGNSIGTLTIAGDLDSRDGVVLLETALSGDDSATDRLIVRGNTSGSSTVRVSNAGGMGARTTEGIEIIAIDGASEGIFALEGDYVVAGAYTYRLHKNNASGTDPKDWYLRSAALKADAAESATIAPEVRVHQVLAPEVPAPEVLAPETRAPEVAAPDAPAPEILVSETPVPEVPVPEVLAPETHAPEIPAPDAPEAPVSEADVNAGSDAGPSPVPAAEEPQPASSPEMSPEPVSAPEYHVGSPAYEAYPQALLGLNGVGTLQQRLGGRFQAEGSDRTEDAGAHGSGHLWGGIEGGREHIAARSSITATGFEQDMLKLQAGIDGMMIDNEHGSMTGGVFVHYVRGNASTRSGAYADAEISTEGYGFGGTLTFRGNGGFYVDSLAQVTWYNTDLTTSARGGGLIDGNDAIGFALSLESGKRFAIAGRWSVTPQAQLTYSSVDFDDFKDGFGSNIRLEMARSLQGRLGISVDHERSWQNDRGLADRVQFSGVANLYYEFLEGTNVKIENVSFVSGRDDLWGGIGLGGSFDWDDARYSIFGRGTVNTSLDDIGGSYSLTGNAGFKAIW